MTAADGGRRAEAEEERERVGVRGKRGARDAGRRRRAHERRPAGTAAPSAGRADRAYRRWGDGDGGGDGGSQASSSSSSPFSSTSSSSSSSSSASASRHHAHTRSSRRCCTRRPLPRCVPSPRLPGPPLPAAGSCAIGRHRGGVERSVLFDNAQTAPSRAPYPRADRQAARRSARAKRTVSRAAAAGGRQRSAMRWATRVACDLTRCTVYR